MGPFPMASTARYDIARERAGAATQQALLNAETQKQQELLAQVESSRALQAEQQAKLSAAQALGNTEMAVRQFDLAKTEFSDAKLNVMLKAFHEVAEVFKLIQTTSSLLLGFFMTTMCAVISTQGGVTKGAFPAFKMVMWGLAVLGFCFLLHAIFLSTITLTDATKLAYQ